MRGREAEWADWMRRANAGDAVAYDRLLRRARPGLAALRRGLARAGNTDAETEDVVQDTLMAVHLKRHTWDPTRRSAHGFAASRETSSSTLCVAAAAGSSCRSMTSPIFCPTPPSSRAVSSATSRVTSVGLLIANAKSCARSPWKASRSRRQQYSSP